MADLADWALLCLPCADQRQIGMSMRPERATLEQVRERLKMHKEVLDRDKAADTGASGVRWHAR